MPSLHTFTEAQHRFQVLHQVSSRIMNIPQGPTPRQTKFMPLDHSIRVLLQETLAREAIEKEYHKHLSTAMGGSVIISRVPQSIGLNLLDFGSGTHGLVVETMKKNRLSYVHAADFRNLNFATIFGATFYQVPLSSLTVLLEDYSRCLKEESMDLIFSRLLVPAMTNYKVYIGQAFATLKSGGYLEMQEIEFPWMIRGSYNRNTSGLACAWQLAAWMRSAGFQAVTVSTFLVPKPDWMPDQRSRPVEAYLNLDVFLTAEERANEQTAMACNLVGLGYSPTEVKDYQDACEEAGKVPVRGECGDTVMGGVEGSVAVVYQSVWVTVGRKP